MAAVRNGRAVSKTLTVPHKEVPILLDCDVLVVGAGVSGFSAAVSASRAGADVVLAEKNHYPGGVATSASRARTSAGSSSGGTPQASHLS